MQTYVVLRRSGWRSSDEFSAADERANAEAERLADEITRLRSYVLDERDGGLGTVCFYEASSPEAIRRHALAAGLPVDEIVKVADTIVVRSDPAASAARQRGEEA